MHVSSAPLQKIARKLMSRRLSSMLVLASILLWSCCSSVSCGIIQFSFIPSPNIQLSQTAVYRCSVLHVDTSDTVSVQWKINGISSSNSHFMSYTKAVGISMEGIGTQNSTVSVPGTHSLNGTTVECLATGLLKGGIPYGNKSRSILYVQGKPGRVNLMCGTHECRKLNCNWSTPHTITGFTILQYNINITVAEDLIVQGVLTDTQYTIDLSNRVSYTVTVVAVTGNAGDLIEGEVDRFQITLNTNCNLVDPTEIDTTNGTYSNTQYATTSRSSSSTLPEPPQSPTNNNTSGNMAIIAIVAIAALAMVSIVVILASCLLIKSSKPRCTCTRSLPLVANNVSYNGTNVLSLQWRQIHVSNSDEIQFDGTCTEPIKAHHCFSQYGIRPLICNHQSFSTNDLSRFEIESGGLLLKESGSVDRLTDSYIVKSVDYIFVVKQVCREIPEQWKNFATAITINEEILQDISDEETNAFHKFCRVIEEWKKSNVRPFTWQVLERVLNELGKHDKEIHDFHNTIVEQYFE